MRPHSLAACSSPPGKGLYDQQANTHTRRALAGMQSWMSEKPEG